MSKRTMRKALALTAAALAVVAGSVQLYAAVTVSSTNVPLAIPDNVPAGVTSTLSVDTTTVPGGAGFPTPWPLSDVNVTFSITHTWDDDVLVRIASPTIAAVTIMQNCGGSGDNFNATTIDDAGVAANCTFTGAPYAGTFQAMQGAGPAPVPTALAAFNGAPANGTWSLTVVDDSSICTGTLNAWSITVNGAAPLPVELQNFEIK